MAGKPERNGRVVEDLVHSIRAEAQQKVTGGNKVGTQSPGKLSIKNKRIALKMINYH